MTTIHLNKEFLIPGHGYSHASISKGPAIGDQWKLSIDIDDEVEVKTGDLLTMTSLEEIEHYRFYEENETTYESITVVFKAIDVCRNGAGTRFITWEIDA